MPATSTTGREGGQVLFDIGPLEFLVIAVVGVLIVGPERLPKMLAEGLKWLQVLRVQATNARREIAAAADLDPALTDELRRSVSEIADLHPKRLAASFFDDVTSATTSTPARPPVPPAPIGGTGTLSTTGEAPLPAQPPAASFDPDAT
jgi:sec-independent protein translocase protein TatB